MNGGKSYKPVAPLGLIAILALAGVCRAAENQTDPKREAQAGAATRRVEARYPEEARAVGLHGFVTVEVGVDERGNVVSAVALSGPMPLRKVSEDAARHWKFKPAIRSGIPVRSTTRIAFHFELRPSGVIRGQNQSTGLTVSAGSPSYRLSQTERKRLEKGLKSKPLINIPINHSMQSPLEIAAAAVRYLTDEREGPGQKADQDAYFMQARIELVNRGDDSTTAAGLQFVNTDTHSVFYVYPEHLTIGRGKRKTLLIKLMTLREDPSALSIKPVAVEFANRVVWGAFPFPPAPAALEVASADRPIDLAPVLLAKTLPSYTEDARANGTLGSVGLRVLVGVEGHVKQIEVTNPLPDGLTKEAVRSVQDSLFKPAMSNGQPASCWLNLSVEFKSR